MSLAKLPGNGQTTAGSRPMWILLVVVLLLVTSSLSACSPLKLDQLNWVDITWVSFDPCSDAPGGWDRAALLLPVRIDGAEYLFQLDTGAGNSYLNRGVADSEGLRYELVRELETSAARRSWLGRVSGLELAGLKKSSFDITVHDLTADPGREEVEARFEVEGEPRPVAGTIGMDLLASRCVVLDLDRSRFALPARRPVVSGREAPFELWGRRPVLKFAGDVPLRAVYDTGSSAFSLMCGQASFESLAEVGDTWTVETTGGDGVISLQVARCEKTLRTGSIEVPIGIVYGTDLVDQLASISGGQVNAIVGNEVFRGRLVILDLQACVMVIADP